MVDASGCKAFLSPGVFKAATEKLLIDKPEIGRFTVPDLSNWITTRIAPHYPCRKTFAEAKDEPWVIFHTSGTTGLPKKVTYTQCMMASIDLAEVAARLANCQEASMSLFRDSRMHSSIPLNHLVGLVGALASPALLGVSLVLGPANRPPTAATVNGVIEFGNIEGLVSVPSIIRDMCRDEESLGRLRKLKYVSWAGAPLDKESGDMLSKHTQLSPSIGTTECGPYFTYYCKSPEDWPYYRFIDCQGIEFEHISDDLYELVFRKSSEALWQQVFLVYPHLEVYHAADMFRKHPTKQDLWLFAGRMDDMIKLANGHAIHFSAMEADIQKSPLVQSALVGGAGWSRPFLLVEFVKQDPSKGDISEVLDTIQGTNATLAGHAKINKECIIIADPSRPFLRSAKGSVLRNETLDLYAMEIKATYFITS